MGNPQSPIANSLRRVLSNFGSLAGAEVVCRAIALIAVGFYARQLQPEMFGYLGFSLAIISLLGLLVMMGMDQLATREIAREPARVAGYAANILAVRLLLAAAAYAILFGAVCALGLPPILKRVLWLDGLTLFPLAITTSWAFQGLQQMHVVAVARVVQSLVAALLVLSLVRGPNGVLLVCASNLAAGLAASLVMLLALRRMLGSLSLALDRRFAGRLLRASAPFALMMGFIHIYGQSGMLLLGSMRPAAEVGLFSSAYRLTFGLLQQFSIFLLLAFMPALSYAYAHAPQDLRGFHRSYGWLSYVCAGGILAVFALFPAAVLRICFGASYAPAAPVLRLLACSIAINFISGPYVAALAATRFERELLWQTAGSAAICLLLNVALIPSHGIEGAAAAQLIATVAGTAACVYFYRRNVAVLGRAAC